jgi:myo-inositol-hexaphosphate 3-phosphohydrolase
VIGDLAWHNMANSDLIYTFVGGRRIDIAVEQGEREEDVWLIIYNEEGDKVESFSDTYFNDATPVRSPHTNYFSLMKDLHDAAGRSARGSDKVVNDLLQELGVEPIKADEDIPF